MRRSDDNRPHDGKCAFLQRDDGNDAQWWFHDEWTVRNRLGRHAARNQHGGWLTNDIYHHGEWLQCIHGLAWPRDCAFGQRSHARLAGWQCKHTCDRSEYVARFRADQPSALLLTHATTSVHETRNDHDSDRLS